MVINKFALKMVNVTFEEYIEYCVRYNKKPEKYKTKVEFFSGIRDGSIVRDTKNKRIIESIQNLLNTSTNTKVQKNLKKNKEKILNEISNNNKRIIEKKTRKKENNNYDENK